MITIIELLVALVCVYAVLINLLRVIWLYAPAFMQRSFLFKAKEPQRIEKLLYYLLAIAALLYNIFYTIEKTF